MPAALRTTSGRLRAWLGMLCRMPRGCSSMRAALCVGTMTMNLSEVLAGRNVGIEEEEDNIWLVGFMRYAIGSFDREACRVAPVDNPFDLKALTLSPA